eukprot:3299445-Pleurochrysis_carterae.AAC.2
MAVSAHKQVKCAHKLACTRTSLITRRCEHEMLQVLSSNRSHGLSRACKHTLGKKRCFSATYRRCKSVHSNAQLDRHEYPPARTASGKRGSRVWGQVSGSVACGDVLGSGVAAKANQEGARVPWRAQGIQIWGKQVP